MGDLYLNEGKRKFLVILNYEAEIDVKSEKEVRQYVQLLKNNLSNYKKFDVISLDIEVEEI